MMSINFRPYLKLKLLMLNARLVLLKCILTLKVKIVVYMFFIIFLFYFTDCWKSNSNDKDGYLKNKGKY